MAQQPRHRYCNAMRIAFVILLSCALYVDAAGIWKPLQSLWPFGRSSSVDEDRQNPLVPTESLFPSKPIDDDDEDEEETPRRGWFGRKKPTTTAKSTMSQDLIEEAAQLLMKRQEAIQEEASKVMAQIETIASEKSSHLQQSLIEHANRRQQELVTEVEELSKYTERLLADRAHRFESHARATLQALDRAALEEGRRLKQIGMALAEQTLSQAEQKALDGLTALEQNAMEQVVKLGAHIVESITKGKKKKETTTEIIQRQLLGKDRPSRHLAWVRSSAVFLAILLAISPPYWERIGGNDGVQAVVPGGIGSLLSSNPDTVRPIASITCAMSAILLTVRWPHKHEWMLQRIGALLVFLIGRFETIETTLMSICAIALLLSSEAPKSTGKSHCF